MKDPLIKGRYEREFCDADQIALDEESLKSSEGRLFLKIKLKPSPSCRREAALIDKLNFYFVQMVLPISKPSIMASPPSPTFEASPMTRTS